MDSWGPELIKRHLECLQVGVHKLRVGNRVQLNPKGPADVLDDILRGLTATIESIEQNLDGRVYVAVTIDDNPGKDLGQLRQSGHRFFFRPEECDPIPEKEEG